MDRILGLEKSGVGWDIQTGVETRWKGLELEKRGVGEDTDWKKEELDRILGLE